MGPDLTREYSKLGPEGMRATLETLYFPAMTALYATRPLTPGEQADLGAFLQSVRNRRPESTTGVLGLLALVGFGLLLGSTWLKGRQRVRSVRGALLTRAGVSKR